MANKFDDADRYITVEWIEKYLGAKLEKIEKYRKYFRGTNGKCYCILGGTGIFHGIPKDILDTINEDCIDNLLVIIKIDEDKFMIFMTSFNELIKNRDLLKFSKKNNQYEFNIKIEKDYVRIKEFRNIPFYIEKIGEFPNSKVIRSKAEFNLKMIRSIGNVSPKQKVELIEKFKSEKILEPIF